ncbi:MAG: isocitrate lyase/PEP mutase family protein [Variibacter sp.]|nr:isocitrate lyase/PEP mutase family protein [Variibacter sp.]
MGDWRSRRERFRQILGGARCVHPGSVFDPISARIAEDLGFECGMFAGSTASLTVLGSPDLITLTLTEFAGQALRIARAGNLPLMVDADHGYGNALNVMRTVEELETAGVSGMSIEDTVLPRPFGASGDATLISIEEGVGKMKAALSARRDPGLVIAGRTSAPVLTSLDDAIARAKAYQAAGVDAIFLVGLKSRAQLDEVARSITIPLILGGGAGDLLDLPYLASRGVRICLQSHRPIMAAIAAIHETLKGYRENRPLSEFPPAASAELMARVTREADYKRWTSDFLG